MEGSEGGDTRTARLAGMCSVFLSPQRHDVLIRPTTLEQQRQVLLALAQMAGHSLVGTTIRMGRRRGSPRHRAFATSPGTYCRARRPKRIGRHILMQSLGQSTSTFHTPHNVRSALPCNLSSTLRLNT